MSIGRSKVHEIELNSQREGRKHDPMPYQWIAL